LASSDEIYWCYVLQSDENYRFSNFCRLKLRARGTDKTEGKKPGKLQGT